MPDYPTQHHPARPRATEAGRRAAARMANHSKNRKSTLQDAIPPEKYGWAIKAGELVCDAEYYNKVPGASLWYTPTQAR